MDEDGEAYVNGGNSKRENTDYGYKITYFPCAEFKIRTFQCKGVTHNEAGRVSEMIFEEYKGK